MSTTVDNAFEDFLATTVRLDPERTKIAKGSKNWLVGEIKQFPDDGEFPMLHPDLNIDFGSFSRKTKIRPLDDIDTMIILHAQGATYYDWPSSISVSNTTNAKQFADLCSDGTAWINSIKVINRFKEYLGGIPQYRKAEIKRNQEAVTLELVTYEWVFDIVPCFMTSPEQDGRTYYLIPDGSGSWKRTDPRIDHSQVISIDASQEVSVLDVIRLVKYWNGRPTMPSAPSYLLEAMVLDYFRASTRSKFIDIEFKNVLSYLASAIFSPVTDPKRIQSDLNTLAWAERKKIHDRALVDHAKSTEARRLEGDGRMKDAIDKWGEVFGIAFPIYANPVQRVV